MNRIGLTLSFSILTLAAGLAVTACSSGDVAVGSSDQALKKGPNGGPTGNGKTCSWHDSVSYDAATGKTTTTPSPNGEFTVGQTFKSTDGCNDCTCTTDGIACTLRACATDPIACTDDAKQCPDGSYVGRTGPKCEFAPCPAPHACTEEAKQCPDGTTVVRSGPKCEFAPCPPDAVACTADAKQCPDGSYVSRVPPSCEFKPCP